MKRLQQQERGLTLIEIMVAMIISLLLVGGVVEIFISSKHTYRMNEQLARLQEDGRLAIEMLTNDIRMIGYQGCADPGIVVPNVIADDAPTGNFSLTGVSGIEVDAGLIWNPILDPLITAPDGTNIVHYELGGTVLLPNWATSVLADTDVIVMHFANPSNAAVTAFADPAAPVQISNNNAGFQQDDVVMISDCARVDIFQISNAPVAGSGSVNLAHDQSVNTDAFFQAGYTTANGFVMSMASNLYFVGQSGIDEGTTNTNRRGDPINSLYKMNIKGQITEMIQGVDSLQIQYGERLATGNLRYVSADDATINMTNVESIKIGLLMHTVQPVTFKDDTRTYAVNGTNIAPAGGAAPTYALDNRIRRVFSSTINLRNRRQ